MESARATLGAGMEPPATHSRNAFEAPAVRLVRPIACPKSIENIEFSLLLVKTFKTRCVSCFFEYGAHFKNPANRDYVVNHFVRGENRVLRSRASFKNIEKKLCLSSLFDGKS